MTISVFFKKTAMVKLAFLDRSMPVQQHSNSLPLNKLFKNDSQRVTLETSQNTIC